MVLPVEYFKNLTHITDLQKLKDSEIYFIIRMFYDELANFNKIEGFHLKGLIKPCIETKRIFKDLRFILNNYIKVIEENNLSFCSIPDIERLISDMDKIELEIKNIMAVRMLKNRVNLLVERCLLNIRILYNSLNDFIFLEKNLWEDSTPPFNYVDFNNNEKPKNLI